MNENDKRIALAEAVGSHAVKRFSGADETTRLTDRNGLVQRTTRFTSGTLLVNTPIDFICPANYFGDLNTLADARNQLINTPELRIKWVNTLRDVVGLTCTRRNKLGHPIVSDIDLLFATAEQLCEALGRTLNLWKP